MNLVEIMRLETSIQGTLGAIMVNKELFSFSLECPDLNNTPNISCIPCGRYKITHETSRHLGEVYRVHEVPGRTNILMHIGNTIEDIQGCILQGDRLGNLNNLRAVLNSKITFTRFLNILKKEEAILIIKSSY